MKFINNFKKAKTSVKVTTIATIIICLSIPFVFIAYPHLLNSRQLFNIVYINNNEQDRIVCIYRETGNSEDGTYLSGYWIKLFDPAKEKPIHQLFIKHRGDDMPQFPYVYSFNNEIWLVGNPGLVSNEKSFLKIIKIVDDKLTLVPADFLQGWSIQYVHDSQITVTNKYNEQGCLNVLTREISNTPCIIDEETDTNNTLTTQFFFVKNTNTSTRSKLYYYRSTEKYPPADVFSGVPPADGTIPGWHLPTAVDMAYGNIEESVVNAYQSKFKPYEYLGIINDNKLFNSPSILHQNDTICTMSATDDDGKTTVLYQFSSTNKLIWKCIAPPFKSNNASSVLKVTYTQQQTIIIQPGNWAICIDNTNGAIKWKCPK